MSRDQMQSVKSDIPYIYDVSADWKSFAKKILQVNSEIPMLPSL